MTFFCYRVFNWELNFFMLAFVFTSTLFTYTFQRFAKIKSLQAFSGPRMQWMTSGIVKVAVILASSGLTTLLLLFFLEKKVVLLLMPLAAIAVLYVGKFPFRDFYNLRDIPFMKAHFISIVWAGIVVGLPVLQESGTIAGEVICVALAIYLFILALAVVFDIRDADVDEPEKKTLPQVLGKKAAAAVAAALCLAAVVLIITVDNRLVIPMSFVLLCSVVLCFGALRKRGDLYFSFWIDGLILLFGLAGLFA
jgi:1,4-dihydroxy-2-naphthoate octaprenyltransferase